MHMRTITSTLTAIFLANVGEARCAYTAIEDSFGQSHAVFLGQVVAVKLLTENPQYDHVVKYEVTIKPMLLFKGSNPGPTSFINVGHYHGPTLEDAIAPGPAPDTFREMTVVEHAVSYPIGHLYFVFLRRGKELSIGACSPDIRRFNREELERLESLRK
jgi:hypothetical protein